MFSHLSPHDGPVVAGLEEFETVYAKNQPEYIPLRVLPGDRGMSAISRWTPTEQQRQAIAAGADVLLEVYHFGKPLAPVRMMVTDGKGQYFRQWFAHQTNAPYARQLPDEADPLNADPAPDPEPMTFQTRVDEWAVECFGDDLAHDSTERNDRFTEEALELVQARGYTREQAHWMVDFVFNRPAGDVVNEIGGVMVTLAALCNVADQGMMQCGEKELARVWGKIPQIREKQGAKPKFSPLQEGAGASLCDLKVSTNKGHSGDPCPMCGWQSRPVTMIDRVAGKHNGDLTCEETQREAAAFLKAVTPAPISRCIGYNAGCDGDLGEPHGQHCPESIPSLCGSLARMPEYGSGIGVSPDDDQALNRNREALRRVLSIDDDRTRQFSTTADLDAFVHGSD